MKFVFPEDFCGWSLGRNRVTSFIQQIFIEHLFCAPTLYLGNSIVRNLKSLSNGWLASPSF
jgi:hypothetical protein